MKKSQSLQKIEYMINEKLESSSCSFEQIQNLLHLKITSNSQNYIYINELIK